MKILLGKTCNKIGGATSLRSRGGGALPCHLVTWLRSCPGVPPRNASRRTIHGGLEVTRRR